MQNTSFNATTDATLTADLKASLLKEDLESRDICIHTDAEKTARLCVSLYEADTLDAAVWKAAEQLYGFMDGRAEALPLINRDNSVRSLYVTLAWRAFNTARLALEGGFGRQALATAYGHIQTHRNQLAARVRPTFNVVEGGAK